MTFFPHFGISSVRAETISDLLLMVIPMPSHAGSVKNCWDESLHLKDALETSLEISGGEATAGESQQDVQLPLIPGKGTADKLWLC